MSPNESLDMWTIYEHPRDYPRGYVVRATRVLPDGSLELDRVAQYAPDLLRARACVPTGKFRLPRQPKDDPCILEVWL